MPQASYNGRTIVVVENHHEVRRHISVFLRQLGANVIEARNGIEGLEAIRTHQPALVLSDILMPQCDGFEMLREIHALGIDRHMPVIAMTVLVSEADRVRILAAGFDAYLPKPFTPDMLIQRIEAVLKD
jgi:two-component system, OmpR family, response regulator